MHTHTHVHMDRAHLTCHTTSQLGSSRADAFTVMAKRGDKTDGEAAEAPKKRRGRPPKAPASAEVRAPHWQYSLHGGWLLMGSCSLIIATDAPQDQSMEALHGQHMHVLSRSPQGYSFPEPGPGRQPNGIGHSHDSLNVPLAAHMSHWTSH